MSSSALAPSAIVLEVPNIDNYEYWSCCVKTYLLAKGLWKVVEAGGGPPTSRKNAEALHVILISCGSANFPLISDATSARVAWNLLAERFRSDFFSNHTDENEKSKFPKPVDDGRHVHHENMEIQEEEEEEATGAIGHEKDGTIVTRDLEETFGAFFDYTDEFDMDEFIKFLHRHPEAVRLRDPKSGITALHMAVFKQDPKVVEEVVQLMNEEDLEIKDNEGRTAFNYAVLMASANPEIVKYLVEKHIKLVSTCFDWFDYKNVIPVLAVISSSSTNWEVAEYLYNKTPKEDLKPENGPNGADIITTCIRKNKFDIAWDLIRHHPNLAITQDFSGLSPLNFLAGMRSAFLSGTRLPFWQQWIYDCICIEDDVTKFGASADVHTPENDEENQIDKIELDVQTPKNDEDNQMDQTELVRLSLWHQIWIHCSAVRSFFKELVVAVLNLFGIYNRIYELKFVHDRVHQLLVCMSQVTRCDNVDQTQNSVVQRAIFRAIQHGHIEFLDVFVTQNPYTDDAIWICDKRGRNVFHFAVECRQEKVYNLLREHMIVDQSDQMKEIVDKDDNSLLHMVGSLSPSTQYNHIRDAAQQMQRELQWFKEMESFVSPNLHEHVNILDKMTGRELFIKNHKELVKEGEKSMKETATSCIIGGSLIVTIMFAAAFTVAGGNNGNTGFPILLDDPLFMVFIVSDAVSLFSSATSVMIFLGILTSRYQEKDFLRSLPTKMMVGLLTLFFSIATMMVAFSATLIIMLQDKYSWIFVPIIVLACLPITSFVWMQYPLLRDICVSTYGPGIFRKRSSHSRRYRLKMFYARMKGTVVRAFTPKLKNKV